MADDHGIDVWYRNPDTGGEFGFSLPLHPSIGPQIAAGRLVPIAAPGAHELPAVPVSEADGDGAAGTEGEEPALYPCAECGDVAVKDDQGFYTDHCAKHTPKTTARKGR